MSNWPPGLLNSCARSVRALIGEPCLLCGAGNARQGACAPCRRDLPRLSGPLCRLCAAPIASGPVCGACLVSPPRFDGISAAYAYDFPLDRIIHAYKYGGELRLAALLGDALAQHAAPDVDAIVAMPLSDERLRARGYNQALELARRIAWARGIPLLPRACRRVIDTPAQARLPWKERGKNVRGAFVCDADLSGLRVAVVDDVLTTGATLGELARNLKRAGAVAVYGWVAARTVDRLYRRVNADFE